MKIIRLIGKNTVEEIILRRAEEKLKLTNTVIKEGEFSLGAGKAGLFTNDKVKVRGYLLFVLFCSFYAPITFLGGGGS